MAANSAVHGPIRLNFKFRPNFMVVLLTCKNEEEPIKMKGLECSQHFSLYKSMGSFSDAQGQLTPQSLVRSGRISNSFENVMDVLEPRNNPEDPIKNEGAGVFTTVFPL